jgi:hypothetical protein
VYLSDEHECFAAKWHCIVSSRVGEGRVVSLSLRQTLTVGCWQLPQCLTAVSVRAQGASLPVRQHPRTDPWALSQGQETQSMSWMQNDLKPSFFLPRLVDTVSFERVLQLLAGGLFQPHTSASLWLKCAHEIQEQNLCPQRQAVPHTASIVLATEKHILQRRFATQSMDAHHKDLDLRCVSDVSCVRARAKLT